MAEVVTAADGRTLAYLEVGDPDAPLVIHNHGGPGGRLEARLPADAAAKNRLRLVCVDRPGMGLSSHQKAHTYAGWAEGAGHFVAVGAADEIFGIAARELGAT